MNPRRRRRLRQLRSLRGYPATVEAEAWKRIYEATGYPLDQARSIVRDALDWTAHFRSARGASIFMERYANMLAKSLSEGNVGKHPHLVSAPPGAR